MCSLDQIKVENNPSEVGFRGVTVIELLSSYAQSCDVEVEFEGRLPLQRGLVRLHTNRLRLEYYCRGKASRTFQIRSNYDKRAIDIPHVKKNRAPLNQEIYDMLVRQYDNIDPVAVLSRGMDWLGSNRPTLFTHWAKVFLSFS